ncbi:MAG: hypothetical protein ACK559_33875, partial [bacterium]
PQRMIANKKIWQFVQIQEGNSRPTIAKAVHTILYSAPYSNIHQGKELFHSHLSFRVYYER